MVKHTQTISWLLPTNCLSVFSHFVGLVLKGIINNRLNTELLGISIISYEDFIFHVIWYCKMVSRVWISRSQFAICEAFWQFANEFLYFFSKICESLKSDISWIFRVIQWTNYIVSYFKPIKYPLLNNNMISQRFIVHISANKFAKLS